MKNNVSNFKTKLALWGTAALASGSAMAVDHSTAIAAAGADGTTNLTAAVTAIIGVVAVIVGAGLVIGFLKRS